MSRRIDRSINESINQSDHTRYTDDIISTDGWTDHVLGVKTISQHSV